MQVGVHPGLKDRQSPELFELGRMGVVVESTRDENIESRVSSFTGSGGEVWFDDVLIRKDGMFVLDELKGLNPENLK